MVTTSPYLDKAESDWPRITKRVVGEHPLKSIELAEVVLSAWKDIFDSRFGPKNFRIGSDIFPKPQIMGFLLHELIPLEFSARYPKLWRGEQVKADKDLVYIPNEKFSIEIKTSSHLKNVFGNRSYAQLAKDITDGQKSKSGYYLTVNFQKFSVLEARPKISLVKFGWIDHSDWVGQVSAKG